MAVKTEEPGPEKQAEGDDKQALEQQIYDRLVDGIIDKQLRPGTHLNEVQLARNFQVPRSRLRRVLERLEAEHVVVFERNRGAFVGLPTVQEAMDVFETRRFLDAAVAKLVCERATPEQIAELQAHVARQEEVVATKSREINRVGAEFHKMLAQASGNAVLAQTLQTLMRRLSLIQSLYERTDSVCLVDEHKAMVEAIARRDSSACHHICDEHCNHIEAALEFTEARRRRYFSF